MLRRVRDAEYYLHVRIKRLKMQRVEVRAHIEVELVIGCDKGLPTQQRFAAAIGIGVCRVYLMPSATSGVVSKLRKPYLNVRRRTAEVRVQNVSRKSHALQNCRRKY